MIKYFSILIVFFGFSCQSSKTEQEVIASEQMVHILTEIHILEAQVDRLRFKGDSANRVYNSLELAIFEKYETDKRTYEESYQYYLDHTVLLKEIYDVVVDSLNVIQKRGYNKDAERKEVMKNKSRAEEMAKSEGSVKPLATDKKVIKKKDLIDPKVFNKPK